MSVATHLGLDPASTAFFELEHIGAAGLSSSRDWRGRVTFTRFGMAGCG